MLKTNDKAIYHWIERPVFEHKECGHISKDNDFLKLESGKVVTVIAINKLDKHCQCETCGAILPIEDQFKEFNILVKVLYESQDLFLVVSKKELIY